MAINAQVTRPIQVKENRYQGITPFQERALTYGQQRFDNTQANVYKTIGELDQKVLSGWEEDANKLEEEILRPLREGAENFTSTTQAGDMARLIGETKAKWTNDPRRKQLDVINADYQMKAEAIKNSKLNPTRQAQAMELLNKRAINPENKYGEEGNLNQTPFSDIIVADEFDDQAALTQARQIFKPNSTAFLGKHKYITDENGIPVGQIMPSGDITKIDNGEQLFYDYVTSLQEYRDDIAFQKQYGSYDEESEKQRLRKLGSLLNYKDVNIQQNVSKVSDVILKSHLQPQELNEYTPPPGILVNEEVYSILSKEPVNGRELTKQLNATDESFSKAIENGKWNIQKNDNGTYSYLTPENNPNMDISEIANNNAQIHKYNSKKIRQQNKEREVQQELQISPQEAEAYTKVKEAYDEMSGVLPEDKQKELLNAINTSFKENPGQTLLPDFIVETALSLGVRLDQGIDKVQSYFKRLSDFGLTDKFDKANKYFEKLNESYEKENNREVAAPLVDYSKTKDLMTKDKFLEQPETYQQVLLREENREEQINSDIGGFINNTQFEIKGQRLSNNELMDELGIEIDNQGTIISDNKVKVKRQGIMNIGNEAREKLVINVYNDKKGSEIEKSMTVYGKNKYTDFASTVLQGNNIIPEVNNSLKTNNYYEKEFTDEYGNIKGSMFVYPDKNGNKKVITNYINYTRDEYGNIIPKSLTNEITFGNQSEELKAFNDYVKGFYNRIVY